MNRRRRASCNDQAPVRGAGEGRDGAFDLAQPVGRRLDDLKHLLAKRADGSVRVDQAKAPSPNGTMG